MRIYVQLSPCGIYHTFILILKTNPFNMSETNQRIFTESLEQVINAFYDHASGASESADATSIPAVSTAQSTGATSKPAITTDESADDTSNPAVPTAKSAGAISNPAVPTAKSAGAISNPAISNTESTVSTSSSTTGTSGSLEAGRTMEETSKVAMEASVRAVIREFRNIVRTPETSEEKAEASMETGSTISVLHRPPITPHDDARMGVGGTNEPVRLPKSSEGKESAANASGKSIVMRTINPSHNIDFEWSLENFSNYTEDMYSAYFSGDYCTKKWQAKIALSTAIDTQYIDVSFIVNPNITGKIQGYFKLGVYNSKGYEFGSCVRILYFTQDARKHSCLKIVRPPGKESVGAIKLHDDELIIKGRIVFVGCCVSTEALKKPRLNISTDSEMKKLD